MAWLFFLYLTGGVNDGGIAEGHRPTNMFECDVNCVRIGVFSISLTVKITIITLKRVYDGMC